MGGSESRDSQNAPPNNDRPPGHDVKQRKIVVLGSARVGKTAVTLQLTEERFVPDYYPTVDQTHYKSMKLRGEEYLLDILDTAGQDDTSLFQPRYTIATDGYVIVYAVDDQYSFDIAKILYERIHEYVVNGVVVLCGNKMDLDSRQVPYTTGQALAEEWKCPFLECSAKKKENIQKVFTTMLEEILKREDAPSRNSTDRPDKGFSWKGIINRNG